MSRNLVAIATLMTMSILAANMSVAQEEKQSISNSIGSTKQHHVQFHHRDGIIRQIGNVVSANQLARGQYEVIFGQDVNQCVFNASLTNGSVPGSIIASDRSDNPKAVFIQTTNLRGFTRNANFNLSVFCA